MITSRKHYAGGPRFRHVVFRGQGAGDPVDLTPPLEIEPPLQPSDSQLSGEEQSLVNWLFASAGLDARAYRPETVQRRLPACLRVCRTADPLRAKKLMETDTELLRRAIGALVIGVTSFFRDPAVFDYIRREIVPALPKRTGHPRVWSIGCSEGHELYSMAMLLADADRLAGATLLGTDCRLHGINRAREGLYDARALADMPKVALERYFSPPTRPEQTSRQIAASIRDAIQWRCADVMTTHEPGAWDMILCRNVVMYFRSESAAQVWKSCEASLRPGGVLVLGRAERPLGATRLSLVAPCVYRKE